MKGEMLYKFIIINKDWNQNSKPDRLIIHVYKLSSAIQPEYGILNYG